jgi:hypothetical protein
VTPEAAKTSRRGTLVAVPACIAVSFALVSCGVGDNPTTNAERITVTESATPTPTPATLGSDVAGRTYDVGTVSTVKDVGDELVLQLDRWTVNGVPDAQLAKDGISVTPHTDDRFTNQNDDRLRTVPVAPDAMLVVNQCVKSGDQLGLRSTPQDAAGWLKHADRKAVLLLTYDASGRVVRLDTDPRC